MWINRFWFICIHFPLSLPLDDVAECCAMCWRWRFYACGLKISNALQQFSSIIYQNLPQNLFTWQLKSFSFNFHVSITKTSNKEIFSIFGSFYRSLKGKNKNSCHLTKLSDKKLNFVPREKKESDNTQESNKLFILTR